MSLDTLIVQSHNSRSWSNKSDLAFWRGRDSRQERLELVKLSRKHPEIIDAKLTNMFFFPKNEELYGEIVKAISFLDFFDVSKILNIMKLFLNTQSLEVLATLNIGAFLILLA